MNKELSNISIIEQLNNDNYKQILNILEEGYKGLFVILKVIKHYPGEVIAGDISAKLNISTARVAVALNTLESKGYVVKHKGNSDKRKTVVELTTLGNEVLEARENKVQSFIDNILGCLTIEERKQLINILKKIGSQKI